MKPYLPRYADAQLQQILGMMPAVSIDGARGVGKTSTALQVARTAYRLDEEAAFDTFTYAPKHFLTQPTPVLVDEWQRYPAALDHVRRAVDEGAADGSYILCGSAAPQPGQTVHTGAGRIVHLLMRPMTLAERGFSQPIISLDELLQGGPGQDFYGTSPHEPTDYVEQIVGSGWPAVVGRPLAAARLFLDGYLQDLFDTNLSAAGYDTRSPHSLRQWLTSYAAMTATSSDYGEILDHATGDQAEKPSKNTTLRFRDALSRLWLLDPLEAWVPAGKVASKLKMRPVHHLVDPGLAVHLLDLDADQLLLPQNGKTLGRMFEALATLCVRSYAQHRGWRVGYLRTRDGAREVDLVVQAAANRVIGIEVKLNAKIDDEHVKHLLWFRQALGADCAATAVLYPGKIAYRRPDGIYVIPLDLLR